MLHLFGEWPLILVKQLIRARVLRFLEGLLLLGCGLSSASETARLCAPETACVCT